MGVVKPHPADRTAMTTTLVENLQFVLTVDEHDTVLTNASVLVRDDRIADVGPTRGCAGALGC